MHKSFLAPNGLDCHSSGVTPEIRPQNFRHTELKGMDVCIFSIFSLIYLVLILCSILRTISTHSLTHYWPKKSANHGRRWPLPLALPMSRWRPNQVHQPHPHIIGNVTCAWFSGIQCVGVKTYGIIDTS